MLPSAPIDSRGLRGKAMLRGFPAKFRPSPSRSIRCSIKGSALPRGCQPITFSVRRIACPCQLSNMFEARIRQASLLKKLLEAVKDLVTDANFDCSPDGISLQAMDGAHVSLVTMLLRAEGFDQYRCDRNIPLGINLLSMAKMLKCAGNDDSVTIKANDEGDHVTFVFESPKADKISDFELKLMDIDGETLQIPETDYPSVVTMPSQEFQRICRDLTILGDTVQVSTSKEGVKFSVSGDLGSGNILVRQTMDVDTKAADTTTIELTSPVELTFALRYLNLFSKATPLSDTVSCSMSDGVPLMIEYPIQDMGYVRFFLAPKIDED